jgi:hypothetical protein
MTLLPVMVGQVFSGDEACQNLDHEEFLFLVQSLPWGRFRREEDRRGLDISLAMGLSFCAGEFPASLAGATMRLRRASTTARALSKSCKEPSVAAVCAGRDF